MPWDKEKCAEGILAPDLNDEIRLNWAALEAMLDTWMRFATGGTQTGQPRQGSARVYFQDAVPTSRLDGEYFDLNDLGCIWIDSNSTIDNQVAFLSAADGAGTETWTPISTEVIAVLLAANRVFAGTLKSTGDFTVGANKVVVTAANGNTAVAGTLGVTGIATVGDKSKNATSAAPDADAQLANKKYVDDQDASTGFWHHDGTQVFDTDAPTSFTDLDLSSYCGSNRALVLLKIKNADASVSTTFWFRTNGDTENVAATSTFAGGSTIAAINTGNIAYVILETDASGIVEWMASDGSCDTDIWILGYVK